MMMKTLLTALLVSLPLSASALHLDRKSDDVIDCRGENSPDRHKRRAPDGRLYEPMTLSETRLNDVFRQGRRTRYLYIEALPAALCAKNPAGLTAAARDVVRAFDEARASRPLLDFAVVISLPGGCRIDWTAVVAGSAVPVLYDSNYFLYEDYTDDYGHLADATLQPGRRGAGYVIRDDGRIQNERRGSPVRDGAYFEDVAYAARSVACDTYKRK